MYNIADHEKKIKPTQEFFSWDTAKRAGYYTRGQLRRRYRQPIGKATAVLRITESTTPDVRDLVGWESDPAECFALHHKDATKAYNPKPKTVACWKFLDTFVQNPRIYTKHGRPVVINSSRDIFNESRLRDHLSGRATYGVPLGDRVTWIVITGKLWSHQIAEIRKRFPIKTHFYAIGPRDHLTYLLFSKSELATRVKSSIRSIAPKAQVLDPAPLPFTRGYFLWTDQELASGDVVGLMAYLSDTKEISPSLPWDLLYIPVDFEETDQPARPRKRQKSNTRTDLPGLIAESPREASGRLKNRTWKTLISFWRGEERHFDLNTALILSARIFAAGGRVNQEQAEAILCDYCSTLPGYFSSRLGNRRLLKSVIQKIVRNAYEGNGHQRDPEQSTTKLQATVKCWASKGLFLDDPSSWDLSYGFAGSKPIELTAQEKANIATYLVPLLSKRDTKGKAPLDVACELVTSVCRLVLSKSQTNNGLSTSYLQQFIEGETGISCRDKRKFQALKQSLIDLGFITILKQGRQGQGATVYGLAGRLARELEGTERPARDIRRFGPEEIPVQSFEEQLESYSESDLHIHGELPLIDVPIPVASAALCWQ